MMVTDDIDAMYSSVLEYITAKIDYYNDPTSIPGEPSDYIYDFNFNQVISTIQDQIHLRPTLSEGAINKAYRDLRAIQAEYDIRTMSRGDYFSDAIEEETDNRLKWEFNNRMGNLHMKGKDQGI